MKKYELNNWYAQIYDKSVKYKNVVESYLRSTKLNKSISHHNSAA